MLSWVYLIAMARGMAISGGDCLSMTGEPWSVGYFTAMLVMWIIMMVGMMVPSAIPMVLIYASIARKAAREGSSLAATEIFVAGYVIIWSLFGLVATIAQWTLDRLALLSPIMMSNSQILGGLLLLIAGVYQLTPVKGRLLAALSLSVPVHFDALENQAASVLSGLASNMVSFASGAAGCLWHCCSSEG